MRDDWRCQRVSAPSGEAYALTVQVCLQQRSRPRNEGAPESFDEKRPRTERSCGLALGLALTWLVVLVRRGAARAS